MRSDLSMFWSFALIGVGAAHASAQGEQPPPPRAEQAPQRAVSPEGAPQLPAADDRWRFKLAPYLWIPAQQGDITVKGVSAPVGLSIADTFDTLTDNFNGAVTLRGEATREQTAVFVDIMYLSLKVDDVPIPFGPASVGNEQGIFELGAAYDLTAGSLSSGSLSSGSPSAGRASDDSGQHAKFSFAPLAGVRVHYLSLEVQRAGAAGVSADKAWADVFAGFRASVAYTESFATFARVDIGAGGSDFTWNALVGVEYRFNSWGSLVAGYRALDTDYSNGSGPDQFSYDMLLHGPFVGMEVRF